jgi:hypothetical protein
MKLLSALKLMMLAVVCLVILLSDSELERKEEEGIR